MHKMGLEGRYHSPCLGAECKLNHTQLDGLRQDLIAGPSKCGFGSGMWTIPLVIGGYITTNTSTRKGGLFRTLKSTVLAGESFFVNEFTAQEDNCMLGVTGNVLGDIEVIHADEEYIVQSGSYVASTGTITLDTKWQGFTKEIFGSNLFMLKTIGTGDVFVDGWGGIRKVTLKADESMILDNYQLVAITFLMLAGPSFMAVHMQYCASSSSLWD